MGTVTDRYIDNDVEAAIPFYTNHLDFVVDIHPAPGFARLSLGNLRLLLNKPGAGGAGQAMPDGRHPEPGGWSRIQIEVPDLAKKVESLRQAGAHFRNDIVIGNAETKFCWTILPAIVSNFLNRRRKLAIGETAVNKTMHMKPKARALKGMFIGRKQLSGKQFHRMRGRYYL